MCTYNMIYMFFQSLVCTSLVILFFWWKLYYITFIERKVYNI